MYLPGIIEPVTNWIQAHPVAAWWLVGLSALTFVLTLIAIPFLVVRIPPDYFAHEHRETIRWSNRHPVIRALLLILKNLLGGVFLIAGLAMLILPGQGVLTILVGMILIDFPGKFRLERWLVSRPPVFRTVNWLRTRSGHPPIEDL